MRGIVQVSDGIEQFDAHRSASLGESSREGGQAFFANFL
jgi:hypothetical protein